MDVYSLQAFIAIFFKTISEKNQRNSPFNNLTWFSGCHECADTPDKHGRRRCVAEAGTSGAIYTPFTKPTIPLLSGQSDVSFPYLYQLLKLLILGDIFFGIVRMSY